MKLKFFLLSISIILLQQVYAQEYNPTAVEGVHWVIRYDDNSTFEPVDGLWEYFASGDTVVNGLTYKKILKRDLVVTQNGPPFETEEEYELFGLIRDDTLNKKVFAFNLQENNNYCPVDEEYLLFDFSLNIGDTVNLCIHPDFFDFVIQDISTSTVLGFTTKLFEGEDILYEGMGSNYGLFEEMFAPFKKNRRYVYSTFLYYYCREEPCDLFVSTEYHMESKSVEIYPNPTNSVLNIKNDYNTKINRIFIYNSLGQKQIEIYQNTNQIDISKLKNGVYFIEFESEEKFIRKKIIKK